MRTQRVVLPWGAWHGDGTHELRLPATWDVATLGAAGGPTLTDEQIAAALNDPKGAPPLEDVAKGRRRACIVVDDLARPTKVERPLRHILGILDRAGVSAAHTTVLVATGTHPVLDASDLRLKVGDAVMNTCRVECHDATTNLAGTGLTYGDRELRLNRTFLDADLRVLVGSVIPHPFAGFSGGAKLVIPGLCDVDATERTHKFVLMGLRAGRAGEVGSNAFRVEIERLVHDIGVQWTVGIVPNVAREPAAIVGGDIVRAHRAACIAATRLYATPLHGTMDCLIVNAYPKDVDLVQSQNALGVAQGMMPSPVREGGIVVMTTAAVRGVGGHGLFAPGGRTYRQPARIRAFGDRAVWLYAPTLTEHQARSLHWSGYPFFTSSEALTHALSGALGDSATAGIIPAASLQMLEDHRSRVAPTAGR